MQPIQTAALPALLTLAFAASSLSAQDLLWAKREGTATHDIGKTCAAMCDGSVLVAGRIDRTATFGVGEANETTLVQPAAGGIYLARYAPDGSLSWAKTAARTGTATAYDNAAFADCSSVLCGGFTGSLSLGQGEASATTLGSSTGTDLFLARFNADGSLAWAKSAHATHISATGVATLADGSIVVTGGYVGPASFAAGEAGATTLPNAGSWEIFVARYRGDGSLAWARRAGGAGIETGRDVAACADGSIVVSGYLWGDAVFGAGEANETLVRASSSADPFVARYTADGSLSWVRQVRTVSVPEWGKVACFGDGSVVVVDRFSGSAVFDAGGANETLLSSAGSWDAFVARYDAAGNFLWAKQAGGPFVDAARSVVARADGSCVVTGEFSATAVFGGGEAGETSLGAAGDFDCFLACFAADGRLDWARRSGGTGPDLGRDLAGFADGSICVVGDFTQVAQFGGGEPGAASLASAGGSDLFVARHRGALVPPEIAMPAALSAACDAQSASATLTLDLEILGDLPLGTVLRVSNRTAGNVLHEGAAREGLLRVGPQSFPMGTSLVEAELLDGTTVVASARMSVQIADQTAPTILGAVDQLVECEGAATPIFASALGISANDGCDPAPSLVLTPSVLAPGATLVTATAVDASGNTSALAFTIRVVDRSPPSFVVLPVRIDRVATSTAGARVAFDIAATDPCGPVVLACSDERGRSVDPTGTMFSVGLHSIRCLATDPAGNVAMTTIPVEILPNQAPMLSCDGDIAVGTDPGQCFARVSFAVSASDPEGQPVDIVCDAGGSRVVSGDAFPVGATLVTCTATDAAGNVARCSFTVLVLDREAPSLSVPATVRLSTDSAGASVALDAATLGLSLADNCDPSPTLSIQPALAGPGTTLVTIRATDLDGNAAVATTLVSVTASACEIRVVKPKPRRGARRFEPGNEVEIRLLASSGGDPIDDLRIRLQRVERYDRRGRLAGALETGRRGRLRVEGKANGKRDHDEEDEHGERDAKRGKECKSGRYDLELSTKGWPRRHHQRYKLVLSCARPGQAAKLVELWLESK